MKELLKHKPDIDPIRPGRLTPLMIAADHGYLEIMEELLKHGAANINFRLALYGNALHYAIQQRHVKIVETLLKNGCNTNVRAIMIDKYTAFELSLYLESIDMVKMVAFHVN